MGSQECCNFMIFRGGKILEKPKESMSSEKDKTTSTIPNQGEEYNFKIVQTIDSISSTVS